MTSFLGRTEEVSHVAQLLAEYRLVTVTGPGGVGKTRLAGEVVRGIAGRFADGAWMVELAAVRDPALVPAAVAATLGIQQLPGLSVAESLAEALTRQQALVVLDNCEHVLRAVAELCVTLLATADDLRVLATSREAIGVPGEARFRLRPLPVPEPGDPSELSSVPAVALFVDRARRTDSRFALNAETAAAVARLVARLDGMPLAIELAAARVEALGVDQLLGRLEDSFQILTSGDRTAPARHQSLAATVEWSYGLLDETERRVFRRLSVFPGSFTLDAAAAVAGEGAEPAVLRLVDCSLITPPQKGPDDRPRYVMLETLRSFAAERLSGEGERDTSAASLAQYMLRIAGQAAADLRTSVGERAAGRWLDAENAALHQAVSWSLRHDPPTALGLAIALSPWWHLRGRSAEAYALLTEAVERNTGERNTGERNPGERNPGELEAKGGGWAAAQYWLGQAAAYTGENATALEHFTAACTALSAGPPATELADALSGRAFTLMNLNRISEGEEDARRALTIARELGYPAGEAAAWQCLGHAAFLADDYGNGVELARRARRIDPATIPGEIARENAIQLTMMLTAGGEITRGPAELPGHACSGPGVRRPERGKQPRRPARRSGPACGPVP